MSDKKSIAKARLSSALTGILVFLTAASVISAVVLGSLLYREKTKNTPVSVVMTDKTDTETIIKKFEVTVEYLEKALSDISELSTAELSYTGICTVEEGKIPLITKKGFSMLYTGSIKAGIDASQIGFEITDREVIITIPKAEIQSVKIDPGSIQFYDEKKALFNWTELSDSVDGMILAEENIKTQADTDGILERADKQAEYIVRGLLESVVKEAEGERDLKIVRPE